MGVGTRKVRWQSGGGGGEGRVKDTLQAPRLGTQACPAGPALPFLPLSPAADQCSSLLQLGHPLC